MNASPVPLAPELACCIYRGRMGQDLKHPLVIQAPYFPKLNEMLNEALALKTQALEEAVERADWHTAVFLHERPFRMEAFTKLAPRMDDRTYWRLLSTVYVDSENLNQCENLQELLLAPRPGREALMRPEEAQALAELPDTIEVHKGLQAGYGLTDDFSFTTSPRVAEWFARRFNRPGPKVVTGTVQKRDVLAFFTRRGEFEILVDPAKVTVTATRRMRRSTHAA